MKKNIITWPENIVEVAERSCMIAEIAQVIGCVDGTMINTDAPHDNEMHFVDRHGNNSVKCMVMCGKVYSFYCVSARWLSCCGNVSDDLTEVKQLQRHLRILL